MKTLPLNLYIEDKLILQFRDEYYKYITTEIIEDNESKKKSGDSSITTDDLDEDKLYEIIKNVYEKTRESLIQVPQDVSKLIEDKIHESIQEDMTYFPSGGYKNKQGSDISYCVREGDNFHCENPKQKWPPTPGKIVGNTLNNMFEHFEPGVVGTWNPKKKSIEFSNRNIWQLLNFEGIVRWRESMHNGKNCEDVLKQFIKEKRSYEYIKNWMNTAKCIDKTVYN